MARNGSGTYVRVMDWTDDAAAGTNITASRVDQEADDMATALSGSIAANGETTITANLPMSGFRHTGVSNGIARNQYASIAQIQDGGFIFYGGSLSGTNTIVATLTPSITAYSVGQVFHFKAAADNTGAVTINFNGVGAKSIKKATFGGLVELGAGDLKNGAGYQILYDGTLFQLIGQIPVGYRADCRLVYTNATTLTLNRKGGDRLCINGTNELIPSVGVTLSNSGLLADTTYQIYAYMNAGVMTLEASTTAHAEDAATGMEIKSGAATRTLVGMVHTNSSSQFVFSSAALRVISYFNRRQKTVKAAFTTDRTTTSTSYTEINSEIRLPFVCWNDGDVFFTVRGGASNNTADAKVFTAVGIETATVVTVRGGSMSEQRSGAGDQDLNAAFSGFADEIEGNHYATIMGRVGAGTGTWNGGGAVAENDITLSITVWG